MPPIPLPGTVNDDTIFGGNAAEEVRADLGNDTIDTGGGRDRIFAGGGDDTAYGGVGNDRIWGEEGVDSLFGFDGDDTIFGGTGNDIMDGGYGGDLYYGGAGNDVVMGDYGDDTIHGGDGDDYIIASFSFDSGVNLVYGGNGDDTAIFHGEADGSYDGGAGQDLLKIYWSDTVHSTEAVTLDLMALTPAVVWGSRTLSLVSVEAIDIVGGGGADVIIAGDFDDSIAVLDGANQVSAGTGNDIVSAFFGAAQTLDGGLGQDQLVLSSTFATGAVQFDASGATVDDGFGSTLTGFESFSINGAGWDDHVTLGSGNDAAHLNRGNDTAFGGDGADRLDGSFGNDDLQGGTGDDILKGGRNDDLLSGDDGDDALMGSNGKDTMIGGAGADDFKFNGFDLYMDVIEDFGSGLDRVMIRSTVIANFITTLGPIDASLLSIGAASGTHAQFVLIDLPGVGSKLTFDYDGTGSGGSLDIVQLNGVTSITAADIWIT